MLFLNKRSRRYARMSIDAIKYMVSIMEQEEGFIICHYHH